MSEQPTALSSELVQSMVGKSHGDLQGVKELLTQHPALANAVWDWGGGDFESALGAAAHTGQREIANLLLEHGARIDLFAAAMMGRLEIVKAVLESFPAAKDVLGPHGIPLVVHAQVGGEEAKEVLTYLESLG